MLDRISFDRLYVFQRGADITQLLIQRMRNLMNFRRLLWSSHNNGFSTARFQLGHQSVDPRVVRRCSPLEPVRDFRSDVLNLGRTSRPPMVRDGACNRWSAFDDVKPVHPVLAWLCSPPRSELPGVADVPRYREQEIRIKRENHIGLIEVITRIDVTSKC